MFEAHGAVQGAETAQPVVTPTPAPAPEAPAPAAPPVEPKAATPEASPAPTGEPTPFTPNFKLKVMDSEYEIPEQFRALMKDAESEKQVREIFEKAYGLDHAKPRHQAMREKYEALNTQHTAVMQGVQELKEAYSLGDFDGFFKKLNIPVEKVLQWVIDKAQYSELPPEQRHALDARRQAEQDALILRKQNQTLEQQYEEALIQARDTQLQVELTKPDIKAFAEAFDGRGFKNAQGKPVTFLDAVIETGEYAFYASKGRVDLSPEQAIREVMARYSAVLQPQGPQSPPIIPVTGAQEVAGKPKKTPTIPNVTGRQTSSVSKPKPKSIEDLKKLAAAMQR